MWPSPRAKTFVFGLHLATKSRITHDEALHILAKKIKLSVEDLLCIDPLTYLENINEERYAREMTRYMSRRVLDDLITLHNVHPRLSNLCKIQRRSDLCEACAWEEEEAVAQQAANAAAQQETLVDDVPIEETVSETRPLLETVLDDIPLTAEQPLLVASQQPLLLASQQQQQKESKFFFDEDHFVFICQVLCFAIPILYLVS